MVGDRCHAYMRNHIYLRDQVSVKGQNAEEAVHRWSEVYDGNEDTRAAGDGAGTDKQAAE